MQIVIDVPSENAQALIERVLAARLGALIIVDQPVVITRPLRI